MSLKGLYNSTLSKSNNNEKKKRYTYKENIKFEIKIFLY